MSNSCSWNATVSWQPAQRNYLQEIQIISEMILDESQSFFQRVVDSEVLPSRNVPAKPGVNP